MSKRAASVGSHVSSLLTDRPGIFNNRRLNTSEPNVPIVASGLPRKLDRGDDSRQRRRVRNGVARRRQGVEKLAQGGKIRTTEPPLSCRSARLSPYNQPGSKAKRPPYKSPGDEGRAFSSSAGGVAMGVTLKTAVCPSRPPAVVFSLASPVGDEQILSVNCKPWREPGLLLVVLHPRPSPRSVVLAENP